MLAQLPQWYQITELLQRVRLLVIPRPGYDFTSEALAPLKSLGARVTVADLTGLAISSTAYRNRCDPGDRTALPPSVAAYIEQEQLYR